MNRFLFVLLSLALASGCEPEGPPMGTVSGRVAFGGKSPQQTVRVGFFSPMSGQGTSAEVGSDGEYELEAPLPIGEYKVYIYAPPPPPGPDTPSAKPLTAIPMKYQRDMSTPLTETVEEGENVINVEI